MWKKCIQLKSFCVDGLEEKEIKIQQGIPAQQLKTLFNMAMLHSFYLRFHHNRVCKLIHSIVIIHAEKKRKKSIMPFLFILELKGLLIHAVLFFQQFIQLVRNFLQQWHSFPHSLPLWVISSLGKEEMDVVMKQRKEWRFKTEATDVQPHTFFLNSTKLRINSKSVSSALLLFPGFLDIFSFR